ncbi:hypothetical protein NQ318_021371 [Aromia moschata]|uniref:Uncharacterized protein n=1 Tax=Aromia moschata TaxID=1265417 RepID=A0AAV8ZEH6_9CUCU|nr:hypothetical protein NQ318_021371 [Aromia moschata]
MRELLANPVHQGFQASPDLKETKARWDPKEAKDYKDPEEKPADPDSQGNPVPQDLPVEMAYLEKRAVLEHPVYPDRLVFRDPRDTKVQQAAQDNPVSKELHFNYQQC